MVDMVEKVISDKTVVVKKDTVRPPKRFVGIGDAPSKVLEWDGAGEELFFEHEKGKFLELSDSDIQKLHHDNKVRYSMSQQLNEKHDPEMDGRSRRLEVGAALARRSQFEKTVRTTSQSARAIKKLQAFVGEGFSHMWSRPDKLEDRLAKGYEVVKPAEDVYAGVSATDGHYETRVRQGETELVLMRIRNEDRQKLLAEKAEKAKRFSEAGSRAGEGELRAMGATMVKEDQGGNWEDR